MPEENQEVVKVEGFLEKSLARSNKAIRAERGEDVKVDLEIVYKRAVEDGMLSINRLERNRVKMFDFSVTNTQSLVMAVDLDAVEIRQKDKSIRQQIRNERFN